MGHELATTLELDQAELSKFLTPEQQEALAEAKAQGIIDYVTAQIGLTSDLLKITPKDDLDLKATGLVSASATENVYLGSPDSIVIDSIAAGDEVQIRSSGAVTDGNGSDNNITYGSNLLILPQDSQDNLQIRQRAEKLNFDGIDDYYKIAGQIEGALTFSASVNYESFTRLVSWTLGIVRAITASSYYSVRQRD